MGVSGGNSNANLLKSTLALLSRYRDVAQHASQKQEPSAPELPSLGQAEKVTLPPRESDIRCPNDECSWRKSRPRPRDTDTIVISDRKPEFANHVPHAP